MTVAPSPLNRFFICPAYSVYYRRAKRLQWQAQTTADYALVAVLSGQINLTDKRVDRQLGASQCLLLQPNSVGTLSGMDVEMLLLSFSSSLLIQHAVTMHLVPPKSTVTFSQESFEIDSTLSRLIKNFVSELLSEKPGKEIVMRALVEQLLVDLLRNYSNTKRSDELELSRVGLVDRRIRRAVELMHSQMDQDLSLRDIAAASYLSPFHFSRLFKKITGSTPHNYLAALRAMRAQLLLAETDLSVSAIATRVGYLSASHFTKAFRLTTGTTPREFRKSLIAR